MIRNKFELLAKHVGNHLIILKVSEKNEEDTLTESQFLIEDFLTPKRFDRTAKDGGTLIYIKKDIHSEYLKNHSKGIS